MNDDPEVADKEAKEAGERAALEIEDELGIAVNVWSPEHVDEFRCSSGEEQDPPTFNEEEWETEGRKLGERQRELKWELGDWLLRGRPHYGSGGSEVVAGYRISDPDVYSVAEGISGLSRRHLVDLASTADRCPASVRTDELTWSRHRVLINERPDDSEEQLKDRLQEAIDEKLSVAAFKERLKGGVGKPRKLERTILVTVPLDVLEWLEDTAKGEDSTAQEFAAELLSGCAASEEGMLRRDVAKKHGTERRRKQKQRSGQRLQRTHPGRHFA